VGHDPIFDSAWAKWAQGVRHSHALEEHIDAFSADPDRKPILEGRTEYHSKRHGFVIVVGDIEPIPMQWRLMLGDAANNFRAALDHLAWALVSRGRTPPGTGKLKKRQEKAVYFPICEDRRDFNGSLPVKLPGVRRADLAKVRRHQPYRNGPRVRPFHQLVMLAAVNSGDKHRTVQPAWAEPHEIRINIAKERDCIVRDWKMRHVRKVPLEAGAELAYLAARKTGPDPQIQVQLKVIAEPCIGNHFTFKQWATATAARLSVILSQFAEPPQKIIEPIADVGRLAANASDLEAREAAGP
jgi:hypothetical protein